MKITIDLCNPDKIQDNIDAQQRAIDNKSINVNDMVLLIDNLWVLKGLREEYEKMKKGNK